MARSADKKRTRLLTALPLCALFLCAAWATASAYFQLAPLPLVKQLGRLLLTPVYSALYRGDETHAEQIARSYRVGRMPASREAALESWNRIQASVPQLHLVAADTLPWAPRESPFVYESSQSAYLRELRAKYRLDGIVGGAVDEYAAMLRLGAWLGTRWDHGSDPVVGTSQVCSPDAVIEAGERGAKYWCEIAARTMVHAATAMGWQARLITASHDGYTWEHAVAELWSNEYDKWFVIDTDFNIVYESAGIPLSAFELSHRGPALQRDHALTVRRIAPPKASLPPHDVLPLYRYVHVDLRNDWCTRTLPLGSPAGGDRATWWTARTAFRPPLLTAKIRVDDPLTFDWTVNSVVVQARAARPLPGGGIALEVELSAYSPVFREFQISVDGGQWEPVKGLVHTLNLVPGGHVIDTRVVTAAGGRGPPSRVQLQLASTVAEPAKAGSPGHPGANIPP